ncbi:TPA: alpha-amylase family glycosyl hydrolase [Legionella pneumophila]
MSPRICCYNQYPGLYQDFDAMREDLQRIQKMGFTQVWVNPFYTPCQYNPIPNMANRIHSPYAMQNESIYPRYAKNEKSVQQYTAKANELGLMPVFDLVARHLAVDHRFVNGDKFFLEKYNIDTKKWFKRHPNGNLVMHNMDENYNPLTNNPWSDVATFNYDDPVICEQIIEYYWKPFIERNIEHLGFQGIRIDAPAMVNNKVLSRLTEIAKEACQRKFQRDPLIIAETIGRGYMEENLALKGIVTHTMNSVFWMPGPEGGYGYSYNLWQQDDNWFTQNKGLLQQVGPTIGFPGSHDEPRYIQQLVEKGIQDDELLAKRMREKLAVSAFCSDGGWILQYGDEYGATKPVNVFDPTPVEYHKQSHLRRFDLSDYISEINTTLAQLPNPHFPEWAQRVFLPNHPDLVTFIVHQGWGYTGTSFVIATNTDPSQQIQLTEKELGEIMLANGRNNTTEKQMKPQVLYLCGTVRASPELKKEIQIVTSRPATSEKSIHFFQSHPEEKQMSEKLPLEKTPPKFK